MIFDHIYTGMRNAPVTPQEYIDTFQKTRHFLIRYKNAVLYFHTLDKYFESGITPDELEDFFEEELRID